MQHEDCPFFLIPKEYAESVCKAPTISEILAKRDPGRCRYSFLEASENKGTINRYSCVKLLPTMKAVVDKRCSERGDFIGMADNCEGKPRYKSTQEET